MEEARRQQLSRRAEETVNSASDAAAAMLSQCGYSKEIFARAALTAIMLNPRIMECETFSLRKALLGCAQRGLLPDGAVRRDYPREGRQGASPDWVQRGPWTWLAARSRMS